MIELAHDDFFTLTDKRKLNYLKISTQANSNIIQHPSFPFDPTPGGGYGRNLQMEVEYEEPAESQFPEWSNRFELMPNEIYHQKFRLGQLLDFAFVQNFMEGCLDAFASIAFPNEIFWYDTGYWSSRHRRDLFIGIGLDTLESAFETLDSDMFTCCLANRDSTAIIQGVLKKNPVISIDIYVTNAFLPFTEVADVFRSSIRSLGADKSLKEEFILEATMHFRYSVNNLFTIRPKAFVMMESYPILAVIENPAGKVAEPLSSLDLIIGSALGAFDEDGSVSKENFRLRVDQWVFGDTNLFQFSFTREEKLDRLLEKVGLGHMSGNMELNRRFSADLMECL